MEEIKKRPGIRYADELPEADDMSFTSSSNEDTESDALLSDVLHCDLTDIDTGSITVGGNTSDRVISDCGISECGSSGYDVLECDISERELYPCVPWSESDDAHVSY